ncbi:hypothetical protein BPOR_0414g00050 [Botrytis porri]|uniref:Uncharacterized protein n=1 Tax=Botrytis porri TaxID=87229 RepID=A0A4Z1KGS5_9HELO|nr:hypothetical protein BPOR_0414g00050 [Botrytis porri]
MRNSLVTPLPLVKITTKVLGSPGYSLRRFIDTSIDFIFTSLPERRMMARHKFAHELIKIKLTIMHVQKLDTET